MCFAIQHDDGLRIDKVSRAFHIEVGGVDREVMTRAIDTDLQFRNTRTPALLVKSLSLLSIEGRYRKPAVLGPWHALHTDWTVDSAQTWLQ